MRLVKKAGEDMCWIRTECFPAVVSGTGHGRDVLLGIGGNIGDVSRRFGHLCHFLKSLRAVSVVETSPILLNPPFGFLEQPSFLNALIHIRTGLDPVRLLKLLLRIEKRFGRKRSFANAPRTLDIDIIFYSDIRVDLPYLKIPHPAWSERESVLMPMRFMKGLPWSKRHS